MRPKAIVLCIVGLVAVLIVVATATPASAKPTYSGVCSGCHVLDPGVGVSVGETSKGVTYTTYSFTIGGSNGGGFGYGVFDSRGAKVAAGSGATGSFTVANGESYTFYGVNKDSGSMRGFASTTLNPTALQAPDPSPSPSPAPAPPVTAPVPSPVSAKGEREVEGNVQRIADGTWTVDGVTVTVDISTTIEGGNPIVGSRVKIKGIITADGALLAKEVKVKGSEVENADEDEPYEDDPGKDKRKVTRGPTVAPVARPWPGFVPPGQAKEREAKRDEVRGEKERDEHKRVMERQRDAKRDAVRGEEDENERDREKKMEKKDD